MPYSPVAVNKIYDYEFSIPRNRRIIRDYVIIFAAIGE